MYTLEDLLAERPVDQKEIDRMKEEMIREEKAYALKELRETLNMTQTDLARKAGIGQNRVSQVEHGDISTFQVKTLEQYVNALGMKLCIAVETPNGTHRIPLHAA